MKYTPFFRVLLCSQYKHLALYHIGDIQSPPPPPRVPHTRLGLLQALIRRRSPSTFAARGFGYGAVWLMHRQRRRVSTCWHYRRRLPTQCHVLLTKWSLNIVSCDYCCVFFKRVNYLREYVELAALDSIFSKHCSDYRPFVTWFMCMCVAAKGAF